MRRSGCPRCAMRRSGRWCWARIVELTSKLDTVRVLGELGIDSPSRVTLMRCLKRAVERDYRATSDACSTRATRTGRLALVHYDVTTLCFETPREDGLRKVGMSTRRRVDPQVTVGLRTDLGRVSAGRTRLYEGDKAETKTLIPVLTDFREQHPETADIIVVADAGMLSAASRLAVEARWKPWLSKVAMSGS